MAKVANFEVTFELQGLKIHVKGDREIAPSIANNVGRHFANVLSPAGLIEAPKNGNEPTVRVIEADARTNRSRKRKIVTVPSEGNETVALTWTHDVTRWGSPVQNWKTLQKSAWLLHVVGQALNKHDLSAGEIAEIYKAHFRDAGPPRPNHISRDLSKELLLFGEENGRYYLKQAGKDLADKLVGEAKAGAVAA
jgi:hypothetical protein